MGSEGHLGWNYIKGREVASYSFSYLLSNEVGGVNEGRDTRVLGLDRCGGHLDWPNDEYLVRECSLGLTHTRL